MWEIWVRSLGREDSLEKEMATHSSILPWRIPWMEEPGRLQSTGSQRVGHDRATSLCVIITYLPKLVFYTQTSHSLNLAFHVIFVKNLVWSHFKAYDEPMISGNLIL